LDFYLDRQIQFAYIYIKETLKEIRMKYTLAENMLRFGPKNLSESDKVKLYQIVEQTTLSADVKDHTYFEAVVKLLGDRSKRFWLGTDAGPGKIAMTDADRIAVLNHVQKYVERSMKIHGITDINKGLKILTGVVIDPIGVTTPTIPAESPPVPVYTPYSGTYPAVGQANPNLQNFYLDDNDIAVSAEKKSIFDALVKSLLASIPQNEKIVEVRISAGSATSKVPTTYPDKLGTYKTIPEGQKNNIALATDRINTIIASLDEVVKSNIPTMANNIKINTLQAEPNIGPDYTEKERAFFFGTGKLDPAKKSQYDSTYGPSKGSYGSVTIITLAEKVIPSFTEPNTLVSQKWQARVTINPGQKYKAPRKKSRLNKTPGGGQTFVGGSFNTLSCPFWN